MKSSQFVLIIFLIALSYCKGQDKRNSAKNSSIVLPLPAVIKNFKTVAVPPDYDTSLVSQYIRSIFQDSNGNLWFGTLGEGAVRYDVKTLRYFSNTDGLISKSIHAINEDKAGHLWFGTDQGVYKFDGKKFRNYKERDGLANIDISRQGILVDKTGKVWVGTHEGVYIYDPSADRIGAPSFFLFQKLDRILVSGIMEDQSGNIWFATPHNGVFRYGGDTIVHISEKDGLGNNYAGGIAQDKEGNIWFTMKDGICKYDGKNLKEYTQKDGLGGTEIWGIYIEQSGIIWITARGSTTRFDPSIPLPNSKAFTVYTTEHGINCCVQSMYQDRTGNMWWGAGSGLYRFNGKKFYKVKRHGPWK